MKITTTTMRVLYDGKAYYTVKSYKAPPIIKFMEDPERKGVFLAANRKLDIKMIQSLLTVEVKAISSLPRRRTSFGAKMMRMKTRSK